MSCSWKLSTIKLWHKNHHTHRILRLVSTFSNSMAENLLSLFLLRSLWEQKKGRDEYWLLLSSKHSKLTNVACCLCSCCYNYHVLLMRKKKLVCISVSVVAFTMGLVRITSWYPNFNGSHFGLPPSEILRITGLPPKIACTMTYSHVPHFLST